MADGTQVVASGQGFDGQQNPTVDIIAIHGLNPLNKPNCGIETWQKLKKDGTTSFWLQDELKSQIPNARVIVYEYDSNPAFGKGKERFVHQANNLLENLRIDREEDPERPVVFLGYSLGGILIKQVLRIKAQDVLAKYLLQALVNAHNNPDYKSIKESTKGLMFFGTPHGGGNDTHVNFGKLCSSIVRAATLAPSKDILDAVSRGSQFSDVLNENWRYQARLYETVSFYEGKGNIVSRQDAVSGVWGTQHKLDATHRDLCRFDLGDKDDQRNFRLVIYNLRSMCTRAAEAAGSSYDKRRGEIRNWLTSTNESVSHKRAAALRQGGTGKWLVKGPIFSSWFSDEDKGFLWISGIPGAGKTILASTIIDEIQDRLQNICGPKRGVYGFAYFYCDYKDPKKKDILDVLRCLISQLSGQSQCLFQALNDMFLARKTASATYQAQSLDMDTMMELLDKRVGDLEQILIVIDALDECSNLDAAKNISKIYHASLGKIRLLITSRIEYHILQAFLGLDQLTISKDDVSPDIELYAGAEVKKKIMESPRWLRASGELKPITIISKVVEKAQGMFLLANFHLKFVFKQRNNQKIQWALDVLPDSIDDTYAGLLRRTEIHDEHQLVIRLLCWMTGAVRPLRLNELAEAVSIENGQTRMNRDVIMNEPERLTEIFGPLIRTDNKTNEVFLAHYSLKEYLVSSRILEPKEGEIDASRYHIEPSRTSLYLSKVCLTYLLLKDFTPICHEATEMEKRRREYEFLDYATLYGGEHMRIVEEGRAEIIQLLDKLFAPAITTANALSNEFLRHSENHILHAIFTVYITPLKDFAKNIRTTSWQPEYNGSRCDPHASVFEWGPRPGMVIKEPIASVQEYSEEELNTFFEDIVILQRQSEYDITMRPNCISWIQLYRKLAPPQRKDHHENITPLYFAALFGWSTGVEVLLEIMNNVISTSELNHALRGAAIGGYAHIVDLLLIAGADIDAYSEDLGSALQSAAFSGKEVAMQTLLEAGAKVEIEESFYRPGGTVGSALQAATQGGNQAMVEALLDRGADINGKRGWLGTSLTSVLEWGMSEMAIFLLEHGADPTIKAGYYSSSMAYICSSTMDSDATRRILEKMLGVANADVNNPPYGDALQTACYLSSLMEIKMLLEHGAVIDTLAGQFGDAIQAAAFNNDPAVISILLDHGADPNSQANFIWADGCKEYNTLPYYGQVIVLRGGQGLRERWLSLGAPYPMMELLTIWDEPFCIDAFYGPALKAAVRMREDIHNEILLLLEHEPTHKNGHFGNPLQAAAFTNNIPGVEALLTHTTRGADINAVNGILGTALQAAAFRGHSEMVRVLLDHGADTEANGGFYGLPLLAAAATGHKNITRLLLEHGATPGAFDEHGWTRHHWELHISQSGDPDENEGFHSGVMTATRPSGWNDRSKSPQIFIGVDTTDAHFQGNPINISIVGPVIAAAVLADHPVPPASDYYFEIEIIDAGLEGYPLQPLSFYLLMSNRVIALGVCDGHMPRYMLPGIATHSWGYHSDDGNNYKDGAALFEWPTFTAGDVVGCGFNWKQNSLFFTLNGNLLEGNDEIPVGLRVFPSVGMWSEGAKIRANFGSKAFRYEI
ncbi:hypothetical protein EG329_008005 [Mollisiaceae sp. DMI_Dod_QoI]|nr:hypothetical protein EG329_008005 [Helotiales sp. DMI_Dod_QoI]